MKKIKLVLVMALAMAMAVTGVAYGAAELTVTGDTTIRTVYGENTAGNYQLQGDWRTRANLDLRAGSGNVTGYARYRLRSAGFQAFDGNGTLQAPLADDLLEAYIDVNGAFFPGTDEVTTRIGRFANDRVNDWVGHFGRRDGVRVNGINLGPVELALYTAWMGGTGNSGDAGDTVSAISGSVDVDMVELSGIFVSLNDRTNAATSSDYALAVAVTPSEGVSLSGEYASDGANAVSAWKIGGELATMENMAITASTWSTDAAFNPTFRHTTNRENLTMDRSWSGRPTAYGHPWLQTGFALGLETEQAGLPLEFSYASGTVFAAGANLTGANAPFAGDSMSVIGVGTTLANVGLDLAFTNIESTDAITDLVATYTATGLPVGGNVDLTGRVRLQSGTSNFAGDAVWSAPNGLKLGLHYANYDRMRDWNHNFSNDNLNEGLYGAGNNVVGVPGAADGFAITAGYQLNW